MKWKRFTEEQIIGILKESDAGAKNQELCRKDWISEETFYRWRSKYGGMQVSEATLPPSRAIPLAGFAVTIVGRI